MILQNVVQCFFGFLAPAGGEQHAREAFLINKLASWIRLDAGFEFFARIAPVATLGVKVPSV